MRSWFGHVRARCSFCACLGFVIGLVGLCPASAFAQTFVPGDVNNDTAFNVVDATVLRRALQTLGPGITQTCILLPGDVNSDTAFSALDASVVRQALVGLPPGFSQTCQSPPPDGDGFSIADGDCDDTNPLVNPAAFDFVGNGLNDDCSGTIDTPRVNCDAGLASDSSSPTSYANALDLCSTAVESPPLNQRTWGVISGALTLASSVGTPSPMARSIRPIFGTRNTTRFGNAMSVLSTGTAAATGNTNPSHLAFQTGESFGSTSVLPADWLALHGGMPPSAPGCPAMTSASGKDSIMLKLRIRVPANARSFSLSTKHFNADYPEFVCSPFNDYFIVLLDSSFAGSPANPADKNLATVANIAGAYPVGANLASGTSGLVRDCLNGPTGCAADALPGTYAQCTGTSGLTATGMDVTNPPSFDPDPGWCGASNMAGAATAWLSVRGNVVPDEVIEIRLAVWDTEDGSYDSFVLLDDFHWSPTLVTPGAIAN